MLRTIPEAIHPYEAMIGEAWSGLPEGVRRSYSVPLHAVGTMQILGPESAIGRFVARLMNLPPTGDAVTAELSVYRTGSRIRWNRRFGTQRVLSDHNIRPHCFVERAGPYGLVIKPEASDGSLTHRQIGLRFLGVPIPQFLGPRAGGTVSAGELESTWKVEVQIDHPWLGRLCRYSGTMRAE